MPAIKQKDLAAYLGLSTRQIRNLEAEGVLRAELDERGRKVYPWPENNQRYLRYKIEEAKGKRTAHEESIQEAELRAALADAEMKEIKLAQLRGELIHIDDVEKLVREPLEAVAALLKSFKHRWSSVLVGCETPQEVIARLDPAIEEVIAILREAGDEIDVDDSAEDEDDDEEA